MTVFRLEDGLPFITLVLHSNTQSITLDFGIQGIIGSDLLLALGVIIDYRAKTLSIP